MNQEKIIDSLFLHLDQANKLAAILKSSPGETPAARKGKRKVDPGEMARIIAKRENRVRK